MLSFIWIFSYQNIFKALIWIWKNIHWFRIALIILIILNSQHNALQCTIYILHNNISIFYLKKKKMQKFKKSKTRNNQELQEIWKFLSYLRYDPCRPTSRCSWRWPYKIPVHTLYSTVCWVSHLTGLNSLWCTSQGISNWSLVVQYTIETEYLYYCCKRDNGIKPEALIPLLLW